MKPSPAIVRKTSRSRKFLSKVTSGASADPYVAVAMKHVGGLISERDDDCSVVVDSGEVEDVTIVEELEVERFEVVEDMVEAETENCA